MNKERKEVMIDVENLSVHPTGALLTIGAVEFCLETYTLGREFYESIDLASSLEKGRVLASTLDWWINKAPSKAREIAFAKGKPLDKVLFNLGCWIKPFQCVWGNGATMDISQLEYHYSYHTPWKFYNVRDVRTIVDLAYGIVDKKDIPFEGQPHHALDDAKHQAKYVMEMVKMIRELKH